jgi:hypothetical protein
VLLCLIAIGATIVIATIASAFVVRSNNAHHTERLTDKRAELDRAYRRIDALEQMLDEVRANALNVTVPVKSGENLTRSELPGGSDRGARGDRGRRDARRARERHPDPDGSEAERRSDGDREERARWLIAHSLRDFAAPCAPA